VVASDTLAQATAPSNPTDGKISITNSQGTGASATNYTVSYGAPTVASILPTQGVVGSSVVLTGTYLGYPGTTMTLNGAAVTGFTQTATQITFTVPVGATSGNVVVTTRGGVATPQAFTVTPPTTLDLHIGKVQFTQSTQTLDNTVPIVAGKAGLIRVFVLANQGNTAMPAVRVTLMKNGVPVTGYPKIVASPGSAVPLALDESTLTASWNLVVPDTDITTPTGTGFSVLAEVDPSAAVPETDKTNNTMTVPLNVVIVPTYKVTIFPVVLSSGTGNITEANKSAWVARLAKMYPVASMDVLVGSAFTGSVSTLASDGTGWATLVTDLAVKHAADFAGPGRYYFGAVNVGYTSGTSGMGYVPSGSSDNFMYRTAIGWDKTGYKDGGNFPEVFAHESGHNMGLDHAPCGGPSNPDPKYPYAGAAIGVWGYDTVLAKLYSPLTNLDIMSYCTPVWTSDYNYKSVLTFRTGTGGFDVATAADTAMSQPAESLIARGIVHDDGSVELLPSFRTTATPMPVTGSGGYTLECRDAKGSVVTSTPIDLLEVGCDGRVQHHFIVVLPMSSAAMDAVAGLTVTKAGKQVASLGLAAPSGKVVTAPDAQRVDKNHVRITWDASSHPAALVRDTDTGEVIAVLSGGSQTIQAASKRISMILSNGLTGPTHHIQIPE
jgi:Peptidase M66